MSYEEWRERTTLYQEPLVTNDLLGICRFGARIGYEGRLDGIQIHQNLSSAAHSPEVVTTNLAEEIEKNGLECYLTLAALPKVFTASPLGLVDKADGTNRRIHHLSYPANDNRLINAGIPEQYGAIPYCTVKDTLVAIQKFGPRWLLVKRDFESAFRHIPISPLDMPLLGFHS